MRNTHGQTVGTGRAVPSPRGPAARSHLGLASLERFRHAPLSLRAGMIATTALAKEYGARTLFADVSLQLNAGSRYGLVGANGSGKSTLMRILAGDEEASAGTVTLVKRARVGVLRQG